MPYSDSIRDKYIPKLESEEDMFNLESALDYGLDKRLLDMLKFPDTVKRATGIDPVIPKFLQKLLDLPKQVRTLGPHYEELRDFILEVVLY